MDQLKERATKAIAKLNIDEKKKKIRELETESTHTNFWKDHQAAGKKNETPFGSAKRIRTSRDATDAY